ncbi:MAG TPA: esterase [Myxococcota bacterium]|nr:esterase [Myxococcota bacterium]
MREETIAGLRTVITGGPDRQGGGEGPVVALLHGFGANGDDLVGLWRALDVPREVRFAFPEAPNALAGYGGASYAWWMIDISRWQRAVQGEVTPDEFYEDVPEGMSEARAGVQAWIAALRARLGGGDAAPVPAERFVLGGFSQGATLAVDVALRASEAFAGLCVLSGTLVCRSEWRARLPAAHGVPFFQSHGTRDPILPFFVGEALNALLSEGPFRGALLRFAGGHEIPQAVVQGLGGYLRDRLKR